MAEATLYKDANANAVDITSAPAAVEAGEVLQLADGRAAVKAGLKDAESGDAITLQTSGQFTVAKTSSIVILDGGEVMWDHSADSATIPVYTTSKDFYLGRAVGDAASADTTMVVELNAPKDSALITLQKSAFLNASINTAGFIKDAMVGGSFRAAFSATAEAQKIDLLSQQPFAIDSNWIAEAVFNVVTTCDADVGDLNIGVANGTDDTDADSITEAVFIHCDLGADVNIDAESDDGTTEVAATDTTVDFTAGTPVHVAIDGRDETDIQIYVNGVNVLAATTFTLEDGTGPLKALFHLEKTSDNTAGDVLLSKLEVRLTADVES